MQCCQPEGDYDLQCTSSNICNDLNNFQGSFCKDDPVNGWNGGYIQIGDSDTKLCEDFTSGSTKTVANVTHPGTATQ